MLNVSRQGASTIPIFSQLILGGVLERHPKLRIGVAEVGVGWLPFFMEQTDDNYVRHRFWTGNHLKLLPSDYLKRQLFSTFQQDTYGIKNREYMIDNIMWSSDYPHSGADWPNSRVTIANHMRGVPDDEQRKILAGQRDAALRRQGVRPHHDGGAAGKDGRRRLAGDHAHVAALADTDDGPRRSRGRLDGIGSDALPVDADRSLTDQPPGLAVARGKAGVDEQADEVDPAQVVDGHVGDVVGGLLALDDTLEIGRGSRGGLGAVEGGGDVGGKALLPLHRGLRRGR